MVSRKVSPGGSKATARDDGRWSRTSSTSIDVNPCTALVTTPDAVARSAGSAKNERNTSDIPSKSRRGPDRGAASGGLTGALDVAPALCRRAGASRTESPLDDPLRDVAHARPRPHGCLLDEREGLRLAHLVAVHQHGLGVFDHPARLDLVVGPVRAGGERGGLL